MTFVDSVGCNWPYVQAMVGLCAALGAHIYVGLGRRLAFDFRKPIFLTILVVALIIDLMFAPTSHGAFIYFQF